MASMTITTTAAEDTRLAAAFGKQLSLGRNATAAEVKAAIIDWIKGVVRKQEYQDSLAAALIANAPPADIAPT